MKPKEEVYLLIPLKDIERIGKSAVALYLTFYKNALMASLDEETKNKLKEQSEQVKQEYYEKTGRPE